MSKYAPKTYDEVTDAWINDPVVNRDPTHFTESDMLYVLGLERPQLLELIRNGDLPIANIREDDGEYEFSVENVETISRNRAGKAQFRAIGMPRASKRLARKAKITAAWPTRLNSWVATDLATSPNYRAEARRVAKKYGVPEELFLSLVQAESGFNPNARSKAGAIGLTQLMPGTAQGLGVDPTDPIQNLDGGARYLKRQLDAFKDPRLAIAAYNAGPGAVKKYGGVPPYRETQSYVNRVLNGAGSAAKAMPKPLPALPSPQTASQSVLGGAEAAKGALRQALSQGLSVAEALPQMIAARRQSGPEFAPVAQEPKAISVNAIEVKAKGPKPVEAFYDPAGYSFKDGQRLNKTIGGHSDHVHYAAPNAKAMQAAIKKAQSMGLGVRENPAVDKVDPVHTANSYHYRTFNKSLGQAIDVSGSPDKMMAFFRWVAGQ